MGEPAPSRKASAVAIGLVSYPLYLWHWPLLAFTHVASEPGVPSTSMLWTVVAASFVLATLTYTLIEKPIRFGKRRRFITAALCGVMAVAGGLGFVTVQQGGFADRFPADIRTVLAGGFLDKPYSYYEWRIGSCFVDSGKSDWKFAEECVDAGRRPLVLLWGSSVAAALYPGLKSLRDSAGFGLAQFTATGCNPTLTWPVGKDYRYCGDINRFVLNKMAMLQPDLVIMHTVWDQDNVKFLDETIAEMRKIGVRRIVVLGREPWWDRRNGLPEIYVDYAAEHPDRPLLPKRTTWGLLAEDQADEIAVRGKGQDAWSGLRLGLGCVLR